MPHLDRPVLDKHAPPGAFRASEEGRRKMDMKDIESMLGVAPGAKEVRCLGVSWEILAGGSGIARVRAEWGRPNPVFALPHRADPEVALGRYLLGWGKRQHTPAAARAAVTAARAEIRGEARRLPGKCQGVTEC